jgi:hypothetical protein
MMVDRINEEIDAFKAYLDAKKEQIQDQKNAKFHRIMSLVSTVLAVAVTVCYFMKGSRATSGYVMSANVAHIGIFINIAVYFLYKAVRETMTQPKNRDVVVARVVDNLPQSDES